MKFKDFFKKYKIIGFIIYALLLSILLLVIKLFWVKAVLILPLLVLGGFILFAVFPRREDGYLTAIQIDDKGEIQITSWAIVSAVKSVCKEVKEIRYDSCKAFNTKEGLCVRLCIKIINIKALEIGEIVSEIVKEFLEDELDIIVDKVSVIIVNTNFDIKLKKAGDDEEDEAGEIQQYQ